MGSASPLPRHSSDPARLWVARLALADFRNFATLTLETGPQPVVLVGPNGAGKTNLLEAVSLLAPGQGLRRAAFADLARAGGNGGWAVAARLEGPRGPVDIGTGARPGGEGERAGRIVRIDGETQSGSGVLADLVEMAWVTPAMDGLFTGPAAERRRFLDRFILCYDPGYRTRAARFERAMQSRNRLLAEGVRDNAQFEGFELTMAETGVAIAASRAEAVTGLAAIVAARRERDPASPFPWATLAIEGALEAELASQPAAEVEATYARRLRAGRERDRAAGRTLEGPHRSDLAVGHGPRATPARLCSTGEQKALLIGLVLAHAELVARRRDGTAPILLLDEVTAHLDTARRSALFSEVLRLGAQAWMTGTDRATFAPLEGAARPFEVEDGRVLPR